MANVKKKVIELHDELTRARNVIKDILASLKSCTMETDLTDQIGIYARQMPDFKILAEKRVSAVSIIRQVCTGEMKVEDAISLFVDAKKELEEALECIKL